MGAREALRARKRAMRAEVRGLRDALSGEERERGGLAIEVRLLGVRRLGDAGTVMLFSSFGSEVPTANLISRLAAGGRRVALPHVTDGEIVAAEFRPGDPMTAASFGAMEPAEIREMPPGEIDAVVTPGVAFDRRGRRLGYGGGLYDRFLRRTRPGVLRVGICFDLQLVDEVPGGPDDERLDLVVTDRETVRCFPVRRPAASGGR